jgi:hypothetical protein
MTMYRLLGIILLTCALAGYLFIADELRHTGEFLAVTCILFAGLILLLIDSKMNVFKRFAIQWISLALLLSIPIGAVVLDNMPLGISICLFFGLLVAYTFRKKEYKS